ncbi:hypothetical protein [Tenacibaculum geojense]|uniref:Uncharacterized protein n=1 Tax=Tenacibaculum geojense TaxID=915352 RepID=A0ABW3JPD7_9FLAO
MNSQEKREKYKPILPKHKFYDFFNDYVISHDAMKREISEIVAKNRNLPLEKAVNIRIFKIPEVDQFIKDHDLQRLF